MNFSFDKIQFIISDRMRYNTPGDYFGNKIIVYKGLKKKEYIAAVFLHEIVEYWLIKTARIPIKWIDKFDTDKRFISKQRKAYNKYRKAHFLATLIEREFIENLGFNWDKYDNFVEKLRIKVDKSLN